MFGISYLSFSDDIKVKERMRSKRNKKKQKVGDNEEQESEFFEDAPPFDENASFYQMNLSRPLLKVQLGHNIMIFDLRNIRIHFHCVFICTVVTECLYSVHTNYLQCLHVEFWDLKSLQALSSLPGLKGSTLVTAVSV
jgi:hypothetical protein